MFVWRGFTIEQSQVQTASPLASGGGQDSEDSQDSSSDDDQEEEDAEMEISEEWKQRILVAHNSLKARQVQRQTQTKLADFEVLEDELRSSFQQALARLNQQQQQQQS
ncbi:hypothetical protein BASA81_000172 [Batrachochytrium salamandrivorans]|nr:hypothetical protein BASA81_000172 [Batrachochytrium salamandrivorans]